MKLNVTELRPERTRFLEEVKAGIKACKDHDNFVPRPAIIEFALMEPPISDIFAACGYQRTGNEDGYYVDKDRNSLWLIIDGVHKLVFPRK